MKIAFLFFFLWKAEGQKGKRQLTRSGFVREWTQARRDVEKERRGEGRGRGENRRNVSLTHLKGEF